VPESQVYRLKDDTPLECAAFLEPASCCVHAVDRADIKPGNTVAVLGGGAIGLMLMQLSKLSGATKVVVSEPQLMRRQLAGRLGADAVIDPFGKDPVQEIKDISKGGVDVVFESAGIPVTVSQCFEAVKTGGKIILVGVNDPATRVEFSPYQVFRSELSVLGSLMSHDAFPRTLELIATGMLNVQALISHRLNLSQFQEALEMHEQQKGLKILISPK
jgi:2-desacetyl-2-hydroxyethyl bacteriochlorophyllide A dehydrogenase